jgi:tRNA 5-methylaminomethyl-2-thiouridine biosynthesis bifunctional protein
MNANLPQALLEGCGLPGAWAQQNAWRILDIGDFTGANFLATWAAWRADPKRPRMLHYVAITAAWQGAQTLAHLVDQNAPFSLLAAELLAQCGDISPGFNRLVFDRHQVLLTLCVGELKPMLREQAFWADSVFLPMAMDQNHLFAQDRWAAKYLAGCCRRDTRLALGELNPAHLANLQANGFELLEATSSNQNMAKFNPRWQPKTSRHVLLTQPRGPSSCVVIGAGLAGASVASSLARRGWRVRVLDRAASPAGGASGLPVGLLAPYLPKKENAQATLSHIGLKLTVQQAQSLLVQGQDWLASGAQEHRAHRATIWHGQAAWIKPQALVAAWLNQPGIEFQGDAVAARLQRVDGLWQVFGARDELLAIADHLVVAAGLDSLPLLQNLGTPAPPIQGVVGQISWGLQSLQTSAVLPKFPVNGHGNFMAHIPTQEGLAWFCGATFELAAEHPEFIAQGHRANFDRLRDLLPEVATVLAPQFESGLVKTWRNTRCAAQDRLPVVGPLQTGPRPSAWACTALGSRGLNWSVLCAELLAARLCGEPLPVAASLALAIDSSRAKNT